MKSEETGEPVENPCGHSEEHAQKFQKPELRIELETFCDATHAIIKCLKKSILFIGATTKMAEEVM